MLKGVAPFHFLEAEKPTPICQADQKILQVGKGAQKNFAGQREKACERG
jgi:hypothetical protein